MHGLDAWERVSYGLATPKALLAHGRFAEGRDAILALLRSIGIALPAAAPLDEATLAALPPRVLLLSGLGLDDEPYAVQLVTPEAIDAELEAAISAVDGVNVAYSAAWDAPETYLAYMKIALAAGLVEPIDLAEGQREAPEALRLSAEAIAALDQRLAAASVFFGAHPGIGGHALEVRIVRVVHIFQGL